MPQQKNFLIASKLKKILAKEFNTTLQTVHTALTYFNNAVLAKQIRKRARELLIEQANKISI